MPAASRHRQNILNSAIRLFRRRGYVSTGLNDIVKSSGAPKGSLYHYYPQGKEQLGAAAVTLAGQTVLSTLKDLAAKSTTADAFLKRYCDQLAYWIEKSNFSEGCPITTTLLEMANSSEKIADAGAEAFSSWRGVFEDILIRDGWSEPQAAQHANLILSALQGALLVCRVERDTTAIKGVSELISFLPKTEP